MKNKILKIMALCCCFGFLFVGNKVNAQTYQTKWINNGNTIFSSSTNIAESPRYEYTTNLRMFPHYTQNFVQGISYTFNFNFSITNQGGSTSPNLSGCGVSINGSYIAGTKNFSKVSTEYGDSYSITNYAFTFVSDYFSSTVSPNEVFAQCDFVSYINRSSFSSSVSATGSQGNNNQDLINTINANGNNIIANGNKNTSDIINNQNSNTDSINDNLNDIEDKMDTYYSDQKSLANQALENSKVCSLKSNATIQIRGSDFANKNTKLNSNGLLVSNNKFNTTTTNEIAPPVYGSTSNLSIQISNLTSPNSNCEYFIVFKNQNGTVISYKNSQSPGHLNFSINSQWNNPNFKLYYQFSTNCKDDTFSVRAYNDTKIISCGNGNQENNDELKKHTGLLGTIKDGINSIYNTLATTISNLLNLISTKIHELTSFFTSNDLDTSRLNTLINTLKDSSPPIYNIITSLKNYVQSFNPSNSCQAITIPMNTKIGDHDIDLPCGTTLFWDRQDVSTFKTWWNIFVGGLLIYSVGLKLIKVIDGAFDPQKDEVGKGLEV